MSWQRSKRCTCFLLTILTALAAITALAGPAWAQKSGNVGAVNPASTGTPPGGSVRTLVIGTNIVHKERVETSSSGSAQIVFPDQSTLNVGRNSNIVIDEYIYDPNAGVGSMALSVGKGVMRFVGGQISHTAGMSVRTPVGTLGVRGGSVTVVYPIPGNIAASDPNIAGCKGELIAGHIGTITLKNGAGSAIIRPGYAACVSSANAQIITFPISALALDMVLALLTSGPGQTGGAIDLPTDQMASRQGLGGSILNDPAHPPGSDPLGFVTIVNGGDALSRDKSQNNQSNQTVPPPQTPPPPPPVYNLTNGFGSHGH